MKIWRFHDPSDYQFVEASRSGGPWQEGEYKKRPNPIKIEWEPGSDLVGDFTWPSQADIVVKDTVGRALQENSITGFELRSVEMQENSEPAKRRLKKSRVNLPYAGLPLWDLWVTKWIGIDRDRSTVTEVRREDGSRYFEVSGVERWESTWDQERMELVRAKHSRVEGEGLVVSKIQGIFRVEEFEAPVFCTDDVKRLIEKYGFTNVSFLEMGDTLE